MRNKFIDSISPANIKVGFFLFNNVVHPYFFDTYKILKRTPKTFISELFTKMGHQELTKEKIQVFFPLKSGIEGLDFETLKSALSNHSLEISELERYVTPDGWRFPRNSEHLDSKVRGNLCLILDDGSCSGDSLIQMIDEISIYHAKEVVLLCFIGRLAEHKREFFSRLTQLRTQGGHSIRISVYFASHWHIQAYFPEENPNIKERYWLQELMKLQNTPLSIKRIAANVMQEIKPKQEQIYKDYKYLPRTKGPNPEIPKKELIMVRDEIGKVISYRLYKESFLFFDLFTQKYGKKKGIKKNRYRAIEILCAAFVYEPYLYAKLEGILPDVIEMVEDFVRVLIRDNRVYPLLTYQWDKKDIIHLFFIVFRNQKLVKELTKENFLELIRFTQPRESSLNYVLYKLLTYFPIHSDELKEKKYDEPLLKLITDLKEEPDLKEIKKYYNYIKSLPSKDDFNSQLQAIRHNYERQSEPQVHDQKISFNHNVSEILASLRESYTAIEEEEKIKQSDIKSIASSWFEILEFINPILRFASKFGEYLAPYPYYRVQNKINGDENSIRTMVGYIEETIFSLQEPYADALKLREMEKYVLKIQVDLGMDSIFRNIVKTPDSNLADFMRDFLQEIKEFPHRIISNVTTGQVMKTNIPEVYLKNIIKDELIRNLRYHARIGDEQDISVSMSLSNSAFTLRILNSVSEKDNRKSTGEGLKCIKLLSQSSLFGVKYNTEISDSKFSQTLEFKLLP